MMSKNTTTLDRPNTQEFILTDVLRCDYIIQPRNIRTFTSDSYGVISFSFMRITDANRIFNIY